MSYLTCASVLAWMTVLFCASVYAQNVRQPDPVGKPEPDVSEQPAPGQAPKKKPIKRRSVQQVIEPVAPVYRPTLTPPSATPPVVLAPGGAMTSAAPSPPVRINSCDAGGCTDTNGMRYNTGGGNATVSPQGRLCTGSGTTLQCF